MNAILGYSRLLRGGILSGDKAARGLDTLERNASVLTQIVEDVLDISRIVSGKIRLDVQPVELPLVVHNAIAHRATRGGCERRPARRPSSTRRSDLCLAILIDFSRSSGICLSNAVKFTPKKGRVQIRVERVNSHLEIVVSDTGIGIRPEFLPHVFERFRQADAGPTRQTSGLGLGLSIVRHIVEMHGGSVHAASDGEGRGATFRVRLPLMIVHDNGSREPREHPRTEKREPLTGLPSLAGVRVLAIDDEPDALGLLRAVLEAAGAEVTTMSSASDALDRIAEVQPDALVVDLGMPHMDGFDVHHAPSGLR